MNWLMSLIALAGSAATIFTPQIQHAVAGHPAIASVLGALFAVVAHVMPSPTGASLDKGN
jgi:hypothetical protein